MCYILQIITCIYTCTLRLSTCPLSTHAFTLVHLLKRFGGHLGYTWSFHDQLSDLRKRKWTGKQPQRVQSLNHTQTRQQHSVGPDLAHIWHTCGHLYALF